MFSTIMAVALTAGLPPVIMSDRYGYLREYSRNDLTVDNTYQNREILKQLRRDHNDRMISKYFYSPRITTYNGRGYMSNVNPYDSRFRGHLEHDPVRFKEYLDYNPLSDPVLKDYLIRERVPK